jgi:multiple antibiotic resistance protein
VVGLVAVAVAVALMAFGYLVLASRIKISERGMSLLTRFGGLFVATIGIQLILAALKQYFA